MKKEVLAIRISDELRAKLEDRAKLNGVTISSLAAEFLDDATDEMMRIDMLCRNMYEELLKLGDMLSLMMGFDTEAYATMLSRISVDLTEA